MIPLRDVIPSRTRPWVTLSLLFANALVFAAVLALDADRRFDWYFRFGLAPGNLGTSLVTSLFLHQGWMHLLTNLLALWIFGENVEDRMGHARFLVFYLLCGVAGQGAGSVAIPALAAPIVGPGAAIAGVMAAYFALFPHSRLLVLVPLVVVIDVIEIPAALFAAFWMAMQFIGDSGRMIGSPGDAAFVAWSHGTGGATGLMAVWIFRRPERLSVDWWSGPLPAGPISRPSSSGRRARRAPTRR